MAKQSKQEQTAKQPDQLTEARDRVATLREQLAAAERAEHAARVAEGAVRPEDFAPTEGDKFRAARAAASKVTADAAADVAFVREHLARAEEALKPLEVAQVEKEHATAKVAHAADVEALVRALDELPALLGPAVAFVRKVKESRAEVDRLVQALGKLGIRVPRDPSTEESMLADRAVAVKVDGQGAGILAALTDLVKHRDGRAEREQQARRDAEARARAEREQWKRRAMAGELGPEERERAEAAIRADIDHFYGHTPGRNVNIGRMPKLDPAVAAYRKSAGLEVE